MNIISKVLVSLALLKLLSCGTKPVEGSEVSALEFEIESLESGIRSDSLYLDFSFGMTREDYRRRLQFLVSDNMIYVDSDSSLLTTMDGTNYELASRSFFHFHNDSLFRYIGHLYPDRSKLIGDSTVSFEDEVLRIIEQKYGNDRKTNGTQGSKFYWLKGNKRIDYYDTLGRSIVAFSNLNTELNIRNQSSADSERSTALNSLDIEVERNRSGVNLSAIEVYNFSKDLITEYLKSPESASFPRPSEIKLLALENDRYYIDGYVDSQNGFGATTRTEFECWVKYIRNEVIVIEQIDFQ